MSDTGLQVMLAVGVAAAALWMALLAKRPRLMLVVFLIGLTTLPVWIELPIPGLVALTPAAIIALALMPASFARDGEAAIKIARVDILLASFLAVALVAVTMFNSPPYALAAAVTQWVPAYILGRRLAPLVGLRFTSNAVAVAGTLVALWAVLELQTGVHLFESFAGNAFVSWQEIQVRGASERSEGAFGHSIALGGFLVLCAPFVVTASFRKRTRLVMLLAMTGGAFATQSRAALIGLAMAVILTAWTLRSHQIGRTFRLNLRVVSVGAVAVLVPLAIRLFESAGAELGQSTNYRTRLTENILVDLNWIGQADQMQTNGVGQTFYRSFLSIDNQFLLGALQFGWIPMGILVIALAGAPLRLITRHGSAADVALTASAFVLATVAFITQYTMAFWFVAGLAVAIAQASGEPAESEPDASAVARERVGRDGARPRHTERQALVRRGGATRHQV